MAGLGHHRADLQRPAEAKLADAILLAEHGRWPNAYYLAGYSLELGLKARIAREFLAETLPDPALVKNVYVHDLGRLVGLASLGAELKRYEAEDNSFAANWATVSQWSEASRYKTIDASTCGALLRAIGEPGSGVLQWLKKHW